MVLSLSLTSFALSDIGLLDFPDVASFFSYKSQRSLSPTTAFWWAPYPRRARPHHPWNHARALVSKGYTPPLAFSAPVSEKSYVSHFSFSLFLRVCAFLMERLITESLDSLWFYNSVFRTSVSDSESLTKHVEIEDVIEDVFKPIVEDKNNEQESEVGNSFPVKPLYAKVIAMSIDEGEVAEVLEYYCPSPREKEHKRRRR